MAKKAFIMPVIIIMLVSTLSAALIEQKDTKTKILEASKVLFNPNASPTKDKILDSLFQLLDVAASITTASEYKDDIKYRIDVAKELFKDDSLFNEKARQYLSFAYRMMTNGQKYQKPEELDVFVTPGRGSGKSHEIRKKISRESSVRAGERQSWGNGKNSPGVGPYGRHTDLRID